MTIDLPVGRTVYCYFCDDPVVALADAMTVSVPEYPRNSLWVHADCAADREFEDNLAKPRYVVVVWDTDRETGGMEEGGWSFETGTRVLDADFTNEEAARMVRDGLEIEYPYTGQRGWYSKSGPDYSVVVYDRENEYDLDQFDERLDLIPRYPVTRPRYE